MSYIPEKSDDTFATTSLGSFTLNSSVTGTVLVTSKGKEISEFTVTMVNDGVTAGSAEYCAWGSTGVTIHKLATSTVAQVVAQAATSTGTAWGVLTAVGTTSTAVADTCSLVTVFNMPTYIPGYQKTTRA